MTEKHGAHCAGVYINVSPGEVEPARTRIISAHPMRAPPPSTDRSTNPHDEVARATPTEAGGRRATAAASSLDGRIALVGVVALIARMSRSAHGS